MLIKEEYKEKNVRIKGHKSYDVVKEVYRRVPNKTIVKKNIYEEIPQPPLPSTIFPTTSSSLSQDRQWTSEDIYTTEIVHDYNRVRPGHYSPLPSTTQAVVSTIPSSSSHYDHISTIVTPTSYYTDTKQQKQQEKEDFIQEEYVVQIETPKQRENTYITSDQNSSNRRGSDWRNKLKEVYGSNSDDDRFDQVNKISSVFFSLISKRTNIQ